MFEIDYKRDFFFFVLCLVDRIHFSFSKKRKWVHENTDINSVFTKLIALLLFSKFYFNFTTVMHERLNEIRGYLTVITFS